MCHISLKYCMQTKGLNQEFEICFNDQAGLLIGVTKSYAGVGAEPKRLRGASRPPLVLLISSIRRA